MEPVEALYMTTSGLLVVSGLVMVGMAVRAYAQTNRNAMVHLSVGFALVVAATASTTISALFTGFEGVRSLLLVNNGLSSAGFLLVVYSLISY